VPGKMNSEAIMRQKEKILRDIHSTPMSAARFVKGAAHGSMFDTASTSWSAVSAIFCDAAIVVCTERSSFLIDETSGGVILEVRTAPRAPLPRDDNTLARDLPDFNSYRTVRVLKPCRPPSNKSPPTSRKPQVSSLSGCSSYFSLPTPDVTIS